MDYVINPGQAGRAQQPGRVVNGSDRLPRASSVTPVAPNTEVCTHAHSLPPSHMLALGGSCFLCSQPELHLPDG
ncbi:hypothetical protein SKAU_G00107600 [Synaphobranchus kaupii]|uniref:Uncharacterized protein n=1 Tax=Synaphobranchus kaupii TaxID=118154 RepID=A0A9Q1G0G9_SYNKA|nr:hypothetical protein SKAU_G00107600 [Synaphobranchus kaupii]